MTIIPPVPEGWFFDGWHNQIGYRMRKKIDLGGCSFVSIKCRIWLNGETGEAVKFTCWADQIDSYGVGCYFYRKKFREIIAGVKLEISGWSGIDEAK